MRIKLRRARRLMVLYQISNTKLTIMVKTIGSFIMEDNGNGNLSSNYLERTSDLVYGETSTLVNHAIKNVIPFEGSYDTVWFDQKNISITSKLEIKRINSNVYVLEWNNFSVSSAIIHKGHGFISNGKLVGSYWSSE